MEDLIKYLNMRIKALETECLHKDLEIQSANEIIESLLKKVVRLKKETNK